MIVSKKGIDLYQVNIELSLTTNSKGGTNLCRKMFHYIKLSNDNEKDFSKMILESVDGENQRIMAHCVPKSKSSQIILDKPKRKKEMKVEDK